MEVPVQENYVQEVTAQKEHMQEVNLKVNLVGNKWFFSNKVDLMFDVVSNKNLEATSYEGLYVDYLKFITVAAVENSKEEEYKAEL